ncbi:MAG: VWA domain-containing protein [Sedimentisphaerales bacterium]|nr:VWA domain-containing protein [Sedimentisphaerales bacterium]
MDSGEVDSLSVLSPSQAQKRELVELSEEHRKTDFGAVVTAEPGVVANQSVTATFDTDGDGRASSWGDYQYGLAEPGGMGGMGGMGMGGYGGGRIAPPPFTGRPSISSESQLSLKTEDYQRSAETELLYRRLDKKQDAYWYSTHPAKTVEESLLAGTQRSPRQAPAFPADLAYVMADEIWVICRPPAPPSPPPDDGPGSGCLMAKLPDQDKQVALPLRHTDVQARITGYIASVDVTQNFHNPYDAKIEAVYVFPLPQNAAVNDFVMTIGDRTIRGIIRERQEAEQIYAAARREGHVASLLTQERPNIFTQKVANIEPKKQIDVRIHYFNTLAYVDGWYEFVFPLVVGPRFNPPGFTEGVGAVGRGKTGISGQDTEVQYLKPHERSGADVALTVELDAGVSIEQIKSTNHVITQEQPRPEQAVVKLSPLDTVPNKDFVLRYKVAGRRLKSALVTHRDERGGFFTLMLYPPEQTRHVRRAPLEMVFVLDCSGSMNGKPIEKAKDAVKRALRCLQEGDTFQVIRFSNNASTFGPAPIAATRDNVQKAIEYVENLRGSGGTMMIEGIKTALDFAHDPERFRFVCFLTDGYIGNEAQILAAVHERLGASRIFSFGVGTSVNRFLIDRLAKIGRGAVAYISLDDDATDAVDSFYERIQYPALTDIEIDFGGMQVAEVYPRRIPDLFVGRPVIVTGRFQGDGNATVKVKGKLAGKDYRQEFSLNLAEPAAAGHEALAFVWARKKIEQLSLIESADAAAAAQAGVDLPAQIKDLALEYSLMSRYTAFVAVDSSRRTEGDHGVIVPVAVPVPDGVRYETTVQE